MAPGTTIGAAHPVSILPSDKPNETMEKKIENYAVSFIEAIASQRGRNVRGRPRPCARAPRSPPTKRSRKKVIDVIAPSRQALMAAIGGREVKVRDSVVRLDTADPEFHEIEMTAEQRFYFFLSQPTLIFVLLVAGMAALYVEFTHPGAVAPGVIGADLLVARRDRFFDRSREPDRRGAHGARRRAVAFRSSSYRASGRSAWAAFSALLAGSLLLFRTGDAPGCPSIAA